MDSYYLWIGKATVYSCESIAVMLALYYLYHVARTTFLTTDFMACYLRDAREETKTCKAVPAATYLYLWVSFYPALWGYDDDRDTVLLYSGRWYIPFYLRDTWLELQ